MKVSFIVLSLIMLALLPVSASAHGTYYSGGSGLRWDYNTRSTSYDSSYWRQCDHYYDGYGGLSLGPYFNRGVNPYSQFVPMNVGW